MGKREADAEARQLVRGGIVMDKAKARWRHGGLLDGGMAACWAMVRWWCGS